jgi:pyruvate formate lyase activating enzyme
MHFSRFHPSFRLNDVEPTPIKTLERAHKIALGQGLQYVYVGNVPSHRGESTYCAKCGKALIERTGYQINFIKETCSCGHRLALAGVKWTRKPHA